MASPREPAYVERARLTRRAGRYARYQRVVELQAQGMKPKEIAKRLALSERTIQHFLASGTFPEVKKRREAGRVPLPPLLLTCSSGGNRASAMASRSGANSRTRATAAQSE